MEEQILELTRQVTILNERLPNHIAFTEKSIDDHERRLRTLEQFRWLILGIALASGGVGAAIVKMLGA